jgi:hypothetical protein
MNDEQLKALLQQWQDIEPAGNFEINVRRRIRLAPPSPPPTWLWRPALAAALALGVIIGSSAGILSSGHQRAEMQFMSAGTLAGGYARLATEARR